jgi:hypothetical protein
MYEDFVPPVAEVAHVWIIMNVRNGLPQTEATHPNRLVCPTMLKITLGPLVE